MAETAAKLKAATVQDLPERAAQVQAELKEEKRTVEALNAKLAAAQTDSIRKSATAVCGLHIIAQQTEGMSMEVARSLCDALKEQDAAVVAVLSVHADGKLNFLCACGKDAVAKGAHAGKILKTISVIAGGNGGGRPDSATSGAKDASKIPQALAAVVPTVQEMVQ